MYCLLGVMPAFLIVIIWELIARSSATYKFLGGSPLEVLSLLSVKLFEYSTWYDIWLTGSAALTGLTIGLIVGTLIGLCLALSSEAQRIVHWYLLFIGSIPILALAPVLILWFGIGWGAKVFIAALGSMLVCLQLARAGALAAGEEYRDYLKSLNPSRVRIIWYVLLPAALSWVVEGARSSISVAILGVFIGECLNSQAGIGHMIVRASGLYRVSEVWCGILILAGLAMLMDLLVSQLFNLAVKTPKLKFSNQ